MVDQRAQSTDLAPIPSKDLAAAAGFDGAGAMSEAKNQVGAAAAVAREEAELKAAIIVAKRFPRNEYDAFTKIIKACERPSFAEEAQYVFPRGGEMIDGPSAPFARSASTYWGNIRSGIRIVSKDDDWIHLKGWAHDAENNVYREEEAKFRRLIYRKKGGWQKPDERDERELTNRIGAIAERNAILKCMPNDVIEDAMRQVKETKRKAAAGELKNFQSRQDAIRRIVKAFFEVYVSAEMLVRFLGHPLEAVNEDELVKLRGIWKSISDGNSKREEYFDMNAAQGAEEVEGPITGKAISESLPKTGTETPAVDDKVVQRQKELEAAKTGQPSGAPSAEEQERIRFREDFDSKALKCAKCPPYTFATDDANEMKKHLEDKHPNGNAQTKPAAPDKKGGDLFGPKK